MTNLITSLMNDFVTLIYYTNEKTAPAYDWYVVKLSESNAPFINSFEEMFRGGQYDRTDILQCYSNAILNNSNKTLYTITDAKFNKAVDLGVIPDGKNRQSILIGSVTKKPNKL